VIDVAVDIWHGSGRNYPSAAHSRAY